MNLLKNVAMMMAMITVILLSGCATGKSPNDPLEHYNRNAFKFNEKVDQVVYRPVSRAYNKLPSVARKGISNFFNNLAEIPTTLNFVLQLDFPRAFLSGWRLLINTTAGIGGLFDPASAIGLQRYYTDLGITFARWGFRDAPYFVIPFLGPSNFRDAVAWPINIYYLSAWPYIKPPSLSIGLFTLDLLNFRASLLASENVAQKAALDPYVFMRDAYTQKRESLINRPSIFKVEQKKEPDPTAIKQDNLDTWEDL